MAKLSALNTVAQRLFGNMCITKSTLAIGTTKSGYNTTGTSTYTADGVFKTFAAQTSKVLAVISGQPAYYVQPISTTVYIVLCINAAGTFAAVQGSYAGQDLSGNAGGATVKGTGGVPDLPDGWTPFGLIKVVTDATATFTIGTTLFDASGVTTTFSDLCVLPATDSP